MKRLSSIIVLFAAAAVCLAAKPVQGQAGAAAAAGGLQVADAKLGKSVENREIKDEATTFAVGDKVFLWLKVTGGPGDIKVNWKLGDNTDSVSLNIGGNPWRTWSSRTVGKAGSWTVTVTDAAGATLKELTFTVQ
jgi:hypothetical protein